MKQAVKAVSVLAIVALLTVWTAPMGAQSPKAEISGPVGPSPYDIVRGWHKPFSEPAKLE